jgi:hypothetical protein
MHAVSSICLGVVYGTFPIAGLLPGVVRRMSPFGRSDFNTGERGMQNGSLKRQIETAIEAATRRGAGLAYACILSCRPE